MAYSGRITLEGDWMNTLAIKDFGVDFEPGKIKIKNQKELGEQIAAYAQKFENLVVTDETLPGAKKSRADLNKLKKALNDRRKEVKKAALEPLDQFESAVKEYVNSIDGVQHQIDASIKELEEGQRQARETHVQELINQMAPAYGIEPQKIIINPHWLIKSITEKQLAEQIAGEMKHAKYKQDELAMVAKHAHDLHISIDPYLRYCETFGALETIKQMDDDVAAQKQREAARKAAEEADLIKRKNTLQQVGDKQVDVNTGQVVKELQEVTFTLRGEKKRLDQIARALLGLGVEVVSASERKTVLVEG